MKFSRLSTYSILSALLAVSLLSISAFAGQRGNDSVSTIGKGTRLYMSWRVVLPAYSTRVDVNQEVVKDQLMGCYFEYAETDSSRLIPLGHKLTIASVTKVNDENGNSVLFKFENFDVVNMRCGEVAANGTFSMSPKFSIRNFRRLLSPKMIMNLEGLKNVGKL